jgi:hypothetical protein
VEKGLKALTVYNGEVSPLKRRIKAVKQSKEDYDE